MTRIISLFAGPSSGKSTAAAYLYASLGSRGYKVELVREYIKKWAWDKRQPGPYDQFYFFGKQTREESMLLNKVDWIITDSPVWLGAYYSQRYAPSYVKDGVTQAVKAYYRQVEADGHTHHNVWVNRGFPYQQEGRYETEMEALQVDSELRGFLSQNNIDLLETTSNPGDLETLLAKLIKG